MTLKLNRAALAHAEQLIKQGHVDRESDWTSHHPTSKSENEYLKQKNNNYQEYGKWFLAINPDTDPNTKEHYQFPYGDFKKIYRRGLIAVEQRAQQFHHTDVADAAKKLLDIIK